VLLALRAEAVNVPLGSVDGTGFTAGDEITGNTGALLAGAA
jgi:hypothetical protein